MHIYINGFYYESADNDRYSGFSWKNRLWRKTRDDRSRFYLDRAPSIVACVSCECTYVARGEAIESSC